MLSCRDSSATGTASEDGAKYLPRVSDSPLLPYTKIKVENSNKKKISQFPMLNWRERIGWPSSITHTSS